MWKLLWKKNFVMKGGWGKQRQTMCPKRDRQWSASELPTTAYSCLCLCACVAFIVERSLEHIPLIVTDVFFSTTITGAINARRRAIPSIIIKNGLVLKSLLLFKWEQSYCTAEDGHVHSRCVFSPNVVSGTANTSSWIAVSLWLINPWSGTVISNSFVCVSTSVYQ